MKSKEAMSEDTASQESPFVVFTEHICIEIEPEILNTHIKEEPAWDLVQPEDLWGELYSDKLLPKDPLPADWDHLVQEADPAADTCDLKQLLTEVQLKDCYVKLEPIDLESLTVSQTSVNDNELTVDKEEIEVCECPICCEKFMRRSELLEHVMIHIYLPTEPVDELGRLSTRFGLRRCSVRLQRIADQHLTHLRRTEPRNYDLISGSAHVTRSLAQPAAPARTRYTARPAPTICEPLPPGKETFSCKICNKTYSHLRSLKKHFRVHTRDRLFCCKVCKKIFTDSSHFKIHKRVHTGEKPYPCKICRKTFASSSTLKRHTRVHTGEKPYPCKICKRSFTACSDLKRHIRVHTGERPYFCKICKKTFTTSTDLKRHIRVHTGERPFSCKICKRTFMASSTLKSHIRVHAEEKPFSCEVCKMVFSLSNILKRHKRVHTGERLE